MSRTKEQEQMTFAALHHFTVVLMHMIHAIVPPYLPKP